MKNPKANSASPLMGANGWMYLIFIVATSFFTYCYRYDYPPNVFWDEPYHIASAQKYLNGTFFMEQHPPLGKMLIALGEKITNSNTPENNAKFIDTDYARGFPQGFSFVGYRLFPALLAWLTTPLLFGIFLVLTRSSAISSLLSFLYIFDNALIVHSRGAMTDSPLLFFAAAMILAFLLLLGGRNEERMPQQWFLFWAAVFGAAFGFALTTKLVALVLIALFLPVLFRLYPNWKRVSLFLIVALGSFAVAFIGVWQTHFAIATKVNPVLNTGGYYYASEQYKQLLSEGKTASLLYFPIMIRDSLSYVTYYNKGVPRLDLCKPDENGSPFFFWPFGGRSINYRWEQTANGMTRYLYLQANPVIWFLSLLGVFLATALFFGSFIFPLKEKIRHRMVLGVFLLLYYGYMGGISMLDRVMYLYHYFLPLFFSFILFGLVVENINSFGKVKINENLKIVILTVLGVFIFAGFQFYRPLSYYEPISDAGVTSRAIFPLWELHCVKCEKKSLIAVPRER
jgi:dolichyl-phosphate-mannose--protein O-mannosyl transferase